MSSGAGQEPGQERSQGDTAEVATSFQEAVTQGIPLKDTNGSIVYPSCRSRPQPDFRLDPLHRWLRRAAAVIPVAILVFLMVRVSGMPDQVPVHFSFSGDVNRYGSPWELVIANGVLAVCTLGVLLLSRYPRIFNFPVELNARNVQAQYRNGAQLMIWAGVSCAVLSVGSSVLALGEGGSSLWIIIGLTVMFGSLVFFILRMFRLKET